MYLKILNVVSRSSSVPAAADIELLRQKNTSHAAVNLSEHLQKLGILVPAIRPPTVPVNTARLRISLSAAHTEQDVIKLAEALNNAEKVMI